jgi:hypothetical protein
MMCRSNILKCAIGLVLISFSIGSAEFKPSFYVGWANGPSWIYYHNKSDDQSLLVEYIKNYKKYWWELYAGTKLTSHFGLQSGVLFNKSESYMYPTVGGGYASYYWTMKYVNIPILLTLMTKHDKKNSYASFSAGPMLCILRDAEAQAGGRDLNPGYEFYGYEVKDKYHTATIDLMAKAELKFRIALFLLNLGVRYQQGFTDIENKDFTDNQGNKVWTWTTLVHPGDRSPRATTIRNGWGLIFGVEFAP